MAIVKNPFFAGEARGSVGAFTASRNRSGAILRQNASPVQPRSENQQSVRYDLQSLNSDFQGLTVAQIQSWNDFATANPRPNVFGDSVARTGINWFIGLNIRLKQAGITTINTPPATANPDYDPTMSFSYLSGTGIQFNFNPAPTTDQRIWLQWSGNVPRSRSFLSRDTRQQQIVTPSDSSPLTVIPSADLVLDTTQRHLTCFAVDTVGRATPTLRFTIAPDSP